MVELSIAFQNADYDKLIPLIVRTFIKNPIAAKAATLALKAKIKNKDQAERDALLVNFINEHRPKLIEKANQKAKSEEIGGTVLDVKANII